MTLHRHEKNCAELDDLLRSHGLRADGPSQLSDAFRLGYWAKDAEIARLTAALEVGQRNNRDTFDAMCAMRNAINERIPMPSMESDLLQGPENSVFCATVAEAVVSHIDKLTAERDALCAAIFGGENYASDLRNGNFVEMAQTLHAAQKGGLDRAEKAEADLATARAEAAETVRNVWGRCEAFEDEAHEKLQSAIALTNHEAGFWRGQKMAAKSIRRSTEMPAHATEALAADRKAVRAKALREAMAACLDPDDRSFILALIEKEGGGAT